MESTAPKIAGEAAASDEEQHKDASSGLSLPSSGETSYVRHCASRVCGYEVLGAAGGFRSSFLVFPIGTCHRSGCIGSNSVSSSCLRVRVYVCSAGDKEKPPPPSGGGGYHRNCCCCCRFCVTAAALSRQTGNLSSSSWG
ncbi:unnamed protein product [Lactuca virosa]|uniref:Uncharacterized protein n=1 Tax=Lactuca virosa TaxID=75947 RepID=A0AAU9MIS0_9ASTR|nr:unnamed protein product [Lactuca virosa]